jgi:hypothetical protein
VEHVRVDRRGRHHLAWRRLASRIDGPAQREAIRLDLLRAQLLVARDVDPTQREGSNRVTISPASSLSSITPAGRGERDGGAGATGASRRCRRTAGAIAVPAYATGM